MCRMSRQSLSDDCPLVKSKIIWLCSSDTEVWIDCNMSDVVDDVSTMLLMSGGSIEDGFKANQA